MSDLLTKQQLAELLQISVKTIDLWIAKSYGPKPYKMGRMVRFKESDILQFIETCKEEDLV